MNVSKEADRKFMESLRIEDPKRYENLMRILLRGQKQCLQGADSVEVTSRKNGVLRVGG